MAVGHYFVMGEVAVPHVFAYVDPGSLSILFQAGVATVIAIPIILRNYIRRGVHRVGQMLPGRHESASPNTEQSPD
jgi:hypothetical protein